jgi:hypothetical protein
MERHRRGNYWNGAYDRRIVLVDYNYGRPVMKKKRIHPITVIKWLSVILLLATWGLGISGFATGNAVFYQWAVYFFSALLCVAFAPLVIFGFGKFFERK